METFSGDDDDDDDDEIAYFTVRWKTRELVLSTAPKTWDNTDKDSRVLTRLLTLLRLFLSNVRCFISSVCAHAISIIQPYGIIRTLL